MLGFEITIMGNNDMLDEFYEFNKTDTSHLSLRKEYDCKRFFRGTDIIVSEHDYFKEDEMLYYSFENELPPMMWLKNASMYFPNLDFNITIHDFEKDRLISYSVKCGECVSTYITKM